MTHEPKYPNVKVKLVGQDGNAYNLLGLVCAAMRKANIAGPEREAFMKDAMSGNYQHLLSTCCKWVNVR